MNIYLTPFVPAALLITVTFTYLNTVDVIVWGFLHDFSAPPHSYGS